MNTSTVWRAYQNALDGGFAQDEAQSQAAAALDACATGLQARSSGVQGVYLWGRVGRGKTWLMDLFYGSLDVSARRQHHHHFMRWVHQRLFALTGTPDPLSVLAAEVADAVQVLCLDEFYVTDIGDAMILGGLVTRLFDLGVVLVMTSNQPPSDLYANGHHRERLLPAINAIESKMRILSVDGDVDHRLTPGEPCQRYFVEDDNGMSLKLAFERLAEHPVSVDPLALGSRTLSVIARSQSALWVSYKALCEQPWAADDYIALCDRYRYILVARVPLMSGEVAAQNLAVGTEDLTDRSLMGDRPLPPLSRQDNGARRFIALVDECYDRRIALLVQSAFEIENLYPRQGYLGFAFRRTVSRLREMQLKRYEPAR